MVVETCATILILSIIY